MPLHVRFDGDLAILSNVGRQMNDPRYVDVGREVAALVDEGWRRFVVELRGGAEPGGPLLGVLMTLTRAIRRAGGEAVLMSPAPGLERYLEEMRLTEFWDVCTSLDEARRTLDRPGLGRRDG